MTSSTTTIADSVTPGPHVNSYWLNVNPGTPLVEGTSYTVTAFSVTAGGVPPLAASYP